MPIYAATKKPPAEVDGFFNTAVSKNYPATSSSNF